MSTKTLIFSQCQGHGFDSQSIHDVFQIFDQVCVNRDGQRRPAEFSSNPSQTHLKNGREVLRMTRGLQAAVCDACLNSAGFVLLPISAVEPLIS